MTVAAYSGLSLDIPPTYKNESEIDYHNRLVYGKIDSFEDKEGLVLFDGVAIGRYCAYSFSALLCAALPLAVYGIDVMPFSS